MAGWLRVACVGLALSGVVGCNAPAKKSIEQPVTITWEQIEGASQAMARDLIRIPPIQNASKPPTMSFVGVVDNTEDGFIGSSKDMFLRRIRTILMRNTAGKVTFVDARRDVVKQIQQERSKKRAGEATVRDAQAMRHMHGVDYFLTATYDAKVWNRPGASVRKKEMLLTFHLTHAETKGVVWTNDYLVRDYGPARP